MKKRLILGACTALFLGAGIATAAHVTQAARQSSNLVSANIEALADGGEANAGPYEFVNKHFTDLGGGAVQIKCTCGGTGTLTCC